MCLLCSKIIPNLLCIEVCVQVIMGNLWWWDKGGDEKQKYSSFPSLIAAILYILVQLLCISTFKCFLAVVTLSLFW